MAKQFFKNLPDTSTPLTATRFNGLLDGDESQGNLVVESIKSKNVFNPSTAFNGYINTSNNTIEFETSEDRYSGFAKVLPNTTYTISKAAGYSFRIATTTNSPRNGVAINQTTANHTGTSITITTGASDNYLVVFFYSSSNGDTGGYSAMANTIQVEIGSNVSTYTSYNAYGSKNLKDENIVVGSIRSKNMFGNYTIINGWIYGTGMRVNITNGNRMAFVKCEPNTTYTISRIVLTGTFRVGDYNTIPNMTSSNVDYTLPKTIAEDDNGTSITYTTSSTAQYLIVHYGTIEDTSLNESLITIQMEKGSVATTYSPYQNLDGKDTIILTSGTLGNYFSTIDANLVAKSGNVVQIQLRALVSTEIPNNTAFYITPYGPKFSSSNELLIGVGGHYDYNDGIKWGYVGRAGDFRCSGITAGKWVHINTTFITED